MEDWKAARVVKANEILVFAKSLLVNVPPDKIKNRIERILWLMKKVVSLVPENVEIQNTVSTSLMMLGQIDEAAAVMSSAVKNSLPDAPPFLLATTYNNLSVCLVLLGDFTGAMRNVSQAVKLNPRSALFWSQQGTCFLLLGDLEKALDSLETALILEPRSPELLHQCAGINFLLRNTNKALEQINQAIALADEESQRRPQYLAFRERVRGAISGNKNDEKSASGRRSRTLH